MKPPIFVRTLSKDERKRLEAGLRSKGTFTLRRCQMLLASSRGEHVPQIAKNLGCGQQTVRDAIHDDFDERGLDALAAKIGRAHGLNSSHANISYAVFCLKKKNIMLLHCVA